MASVAAGSNTGFGVNFLGAAPDADIVVVKCKEAKQYLRDYYLIPDGVPAYCDANIGMALKYLDRFTEVSERPVVICIGMGTNWGDHAGNSVLARYLDATLAMAVPWPSVSVDGTTDNESALLIASLICSLVYSVPKENPSGGVPSCIV